MKKKLFVSLILIVFVSVFGANIAMGEGVMVSEGKTVKFDYTLRVDGEVVDTSEGKEPLEYVQGQGKIIPGLEKAMVGMTSGEKKSVTVQPEEAYGVVDPQAIVKISRENLNSDVDPEPGMMMQLSSPNGQMFPGKVTEVSEDEVVVDLNHPLAGKELNFEVEIVDVQ